MDLRHKLSFLERILGKGKFSQGTKECEFFCPFCEHHKKKLSINLETDRYQCWICGISGKNLVYLLKKQGTQADINEYIEKHKAVDTVIYKDNNEDFFNLSLPVGFECVIDCKNSVKGKMAHRYLANRGIDDDDIVYYKIGIASDPHYEDRVIFPSFDKTGKLNFYTGRSIQKEPYLKYLSPTVPKGYKNTIIMNELNINWNKPVILVEGFFDLLKSSRNTVPLMGSSLSKQSLLFKTIVENNTTIYLALDADANEKADRMAHYLLKYDVEVYRLSPHPFNDLGEMSKKDFTHCFNNAKQITQKVILQNRMDNLC
jgi:DNA primase